MSDASRYVRYADDVEVQQPHEAEDTAESVAVFARLRAFAFEKHRHAVRDAHAKSHGVLRGTLVVDAGIAPELAQGLFAAPGEYPVIARFSTSAGDILPDAVAAFRGLAIKVIGVPGEKVLPEERDAVTQDFLLVNHPVLETGDVASYLKAQRRLETLAHTPELVQEALSDAAQAAGRALRAVGVDPGGAFRQAMPDTHPLGETYYSMAALRWGDYVAKMAAFPASASLAPLVGAAVDTREPGALRDAVVAFFREHEAVYELRAQLCTDLEAMPVEDASVRWPEDQSPYRTVARLTLPPQDAFSPARRVYADDVLAFNPWHALPAHRPLGSIMRVRRQSYDASARYRRAMNARAGGEPRSIDELPA